MTQDKLTIYLGAMDDLKHLPRESAIEVLLDAALTILCDIQDNCDDPWNCQRRFKCKRAAGIVKQVGREKEGARV